MNAPEPADLTERALEAIRWNFSHAAVHLTVPQAREYIRKRWGDDVHAELEKFFLPVAGPTSLIPDEKA